MIAGGDSSMTAGGISAIVGGRHNSINTNLGFIGVGIQALSSNRITQPSAVGSIISFSNPT